MHQKYTSANTSVNSGKLPKTFHAVDWMPGTVNLDYGGGKFDNATVYLEGKGVTNLVYDPYNRTVDHNTAVLQKAASGVDTVTCNNVLNVIDSNASMIMVISACATYLKQEGTAYFKVYEGDKSGTGRETKRDCYQRNQKAADYLPYVLLYFNKVVVKGDILIATQPLVY